MYTRNPKINNIIPTSTNTAMTVAADTICTVEPLTASIECKNINLGTKCTNGIDRADVSISSIII